MQPPLLPLSFDAGMMHVCCWGIKISVHGGYWTYLSLASMVASFGVKCVCKVFILLWYFCKYLPGSGVGKKFGTFYSLVECLRMSKCLYPDPWRFLTPHCRCAWCCCSWEVGEMSTLGCSGLQMMCPLRCMTERVFWEKGHEERQSEDCCGIFWPQWHVTEPQ